MTTFRGEPLRSAEGWVVIQHFGDVWDTLAFTFATTRRHAIAKLNDVAGDGRHYDRLLRRGNARAVQCPLAPEIRVEDR